MATLLGRTKVNPWKLKTPPRTSEYTMHVGEKDGQKILVCSVGGTVLHRDARCIDDLLVMLKMAGDRVDLGGADEPKPAEDGTVEAWARAATTPVGSWYVSRTGSVDASASACRPVMEELGPCELEHNARNDRLRAHSLAGGIEAGLLAEREPTLAILALVGPASHRWPCVRSRIRAHDPSAP